MKLHATSGWLSQTASVVLVLALSGAVTTPARAQSRADSSALRRIPSQTISPAASTLSGQVQDEGGKPVARAVVTLGSDSTVAGDDGRFVLHSPPGAYILTVRHIGFRVQRFAVSLAAGEPRDVTLVAARFVPVLPTVTTTAQEQAAYRDVGLERRMKAGIGQFMTYDQIARKQASKFTELLQSFRGIRVYYPPVMAGQAKVEGTRGAGSCVSYMVDGMPIGQPNDYFLGPNGQMTSLGPESPDHFIDPSEIGAIEVYSTSERPAELTSTYSAPPAMPGDSAEYGAQKIDVGQQCALVVVWTKARLGLGGLSAASGEAPGPPESANVTYGRPVFSDDPPCRPSPARDTTDLVVYATVGGARPQRISDSAWSSYKTGVLEAVDRSAMLPTELFLPAFGIPLSPAGTTQAGGRQGQRIAPTLSNVVQFTLGASGALISAHVIASSLSASADTSVLAIVERAAATDAFPRLPSPSSEQDSAHLLLVVASVEPLGGTKAAVIGQLEVPAWDLTRAARIAHLSEQPDKDTARGERGRADGVAMEAVIDAGGRVMPSTLRMVGRIDSLSLVSLHNRAIALQFEPALIGSCAVPELVFQPLTSP